MKVFAATVGGIRVVEPAADLAVALAVASGGLNLAVSPQLVAIGEVGLTGEVRRVGAVGHQSGPVPQPPEQRVKPGTALWVGVPTDGLGQRQETFWDGQLA